MGIFGSEEKPSAIPDHGPLAVCPISMKNSFVPLKHDMVGEDKGEKSCKTCEMPFSFGKLSDQDLLVPTWSADVNVPQK